MLSFPSKEQVAVPGGALSLVTVPLGSLGVQAAWQSVTMSKHRLPFPAWPPVSCVVLDGPLIALPQPSAPHGAREPGLATRHWSCCLRPAPALGVITAVCGAAR